MSDVLAGIEARPTYTWVDATKGSIMAVENQEILFEETGSRGKYSILMPNGQESKLTFVRAGPHHLIADHTFVPPLFRGQGIAERLVLRLVDDARASGARITPTCWFVADEFARHSPDWDDLLQK